MSGEFGELFGATKRRFGFLGAVVVVSMGLFAAVAAPAQAATTTLHAAPTPAGTGNCSTAANACSITTAVTKANAVSVTENVRILVADGTYSLSAPSPTALPVTFAGPSLVFEAEEGAVPVLDGMETVRLMSIAAASNVTIEGLVFELGKSTGLGGAIENAGKLAVSDSEFIGNVATNGGAITNSAAATLAVEETTFWENEATSVGGGALINFGTAAIDSSTLLENTAPINGGGVNIQPGGTLKVSNSTMAGNTSVSLGGAFSNLGTLVVEASTIADNSGSDGAAIGSGNTNVTLAADIIAAQTSGKACSAANTFVDGGYNLDFDGTCISPTSAAPGSHNGLNPYGPSTYGAVLEAYLDAEPADNGGPSETIALLRTPNPPTAADDPAFGVIPASFELPVAIGGVTTACALPDQRGLPRLNPCDIGAFELQPLPPPAPTPPATSAPAKPTPPAPAPTLSALKLTPTKLHRGEKATISFKLDIGAKVSFQLKRKVRRKGKVKLVKSAGAPPSFTAAAGSVKRTWKPTGLLPGKYQLLATPAGGASKTVSFQVVARKR